MDVNSDGIRFTTDERELAPDIIPFEIPFAGLTELLHKVVNRQDEVAALAEQHGLVSRTAIKLYGLSLRLAKIDIPAK